MNPASRSEPTAASKSPTRQRRLGEFLIERELGRGGMGVVYLARQESMGRQVALKVLPSFAGMDTTAVARFRREAEATGRLSHPGIVPVHGVGEHDGVHYFVMDYVDGPNLGLVLDSIGLRQPARLRESLAVEAQIGDRFPGLREPARDGRANGNDYVRSCARLMAEVASALAVAHRARIVHRDLKPSNILIHPSGRPVLVDFGLARDEQSLALTRTGEQVGTPAYMAPEQASGGRRLDARVDVWGLGAVLYELLALRPPFEGGNVGEIARAVLEEEPVPIRRRNPNVPVDLAVIVHHCLTKEPDERYPAIEAVEADLRAFLAGNPIHARAPGLGARLRSGLQRRRRSLLAASGSVVAAIGIALLAGVMGRQADIRRGQQALAEAHHALVEQGEPDRARDLYQRAAALTNDAAVISRQRVTDFRQAFERHYPARPAILQQFAQHFDRAERAALTDLLGRLEGRGTLHLDAGRGEPAVARLAVRRLVDGALADGWQECRPGEQLPLGEYLVRAESDTGTAAQTWVRVVRDQRQPIQPQFFAPEDLPDGSAACQDPRTGAWLALALHEVTRGEYRQWLSAVADPVLRAELTPLLWDGGESRPRHPVRGLSFHQARTMAALRGAHLPSSRELWLGASGGLQGLAYPWGSRFTAERIAADPFRLSGPEAVDSRADGRSPLGLHHVLGNVAELLSPAGSAQLHAGGGHFLADDPAGLRLADEGVPLMPLRDVLHQDPNTGMRLAWFLPPAEAVAGSGLESRREQVRANTTGALIHDWTITADGTVRYRLEINGIHGGGSHLRRVPLVTPGYLQRSGWRVTDGHGTPIAFDCELGREAEDALLTLGLDPELRPGQGYRITLTSELLPSAGLFPDRDTLVARIPLKRGGPVAALHSLTLPPGSSILEAAPQPVLDRRQGCHILVWEPTGHDQVETAIVRFRVDGVLARGWPSRQRIELLVQSFLAGWNGGDGDLAAMLDPAFLLLPAGLDRGQAVAPDAARGRILEPRVLDATPVGDVVTVDLEADWELAVTASGTLRLPRWPLLLQLRLDPSPTVVRIMPRLLADEGRYDGRSYAHAGLRVRLREIDGSRVNRTQDEMTEMQVKVINGRLPGVSVHLLGHFAIAGADDRAVRFRLTNGAELLRPGRQLGEDPADRAGWTGSDWLFGNPALGRQRERWEFLTLGRRHFLVRCVVDAEDDRAAVARFERPEVQAWFAAVRAALVIE